MEFTSFPYAFRSMWNTLRKGVENGRTHGDMVRQMSIIAPLKDRHGDPKVYSYAEAQRMAEMQGLLNDSGQLNSKEFKR